MLLLAADEHLNHNIVRGLLRRNSKIDILSVQGAGPSGADDPSVLEWAADEGRVLLTHDVTTMTHYAYERVREAKRMPGVFEIGFDVPLRRAIEDVLLLAECSLEGEWEGQVRYLPLR